MRATTELLKTLAHATIKARDEAIAARAAPAIIEKLTARAAAANETLRTATRVTA